MEFIICQVDLFKVSYLLTTRAIEWNTDDWIYQVVISTNASAITGRFNGRACTPNKLWPFNSKVRRIVHKNVPRCKTFRKKDWPDTFGFKLGDTTGDYVAHKIKELNDVKIIMITAYEVNHEIAKELEDNELVVDIVQKPVDIDHLMAKVEDLQN